MDINPVTKENAAVAQAGSGQAAQKNVLPFPQKDAKDVTSADDQVQLSGNQDARFQELQRKNEWKNAQATGIHDTDRAIAKLSQKIDHLKVPLEAIVKNFPPFAPGDETRIKLLMTYSSLRKQIDALTLPPPPDVVAARKTAELPSPLPMDVSDSQIADHLEKLDAFGESLSGARSGLAADTATFVQGGGLPGPVFGAKGADLGVLPAPLNESGAAQKSREVGEQFATVVSQGVSSASSQYLKGLS